MDGMLVDSPRSSSSGTGACSASATASIPSRSSPRAMAAARPMCCVELAPHIDAAAEAAATTWARRPTRTGSSPCPAPPSAGRAAAPAPGPSSPRRTGRWPSRGWPPSAAGAGLDGVRRRGRARQARSEGLRARRRAARRRPGPTAWCSRTCRPASPPAGRRARSWSPSSTTYPVVALAAADAVVSRPAPRRRRARAARVRAPFRLTTEPGYRADAPDRPRLRHARARGRARRGVAAPGSSAPSAAARPLVPGPEVAAAVRRGERGRLHRRKPASARRRVPHQEPRGHRADDGARRQPSADQRPLRRHARLAGRHAERRLRAAVLEGRAVSVATSLSANRLRLTPARRRAPPTSGCG